MAAQLKLVRRKFTRAADIDTLDLLDGANGITCYPGSWTPTVAEGDSGDPVSEVIDVVIKGSSANDLASKVQAFDAKVKEILWPQRTEVDDAGVWLRWQLQGETYARQAYILEGRGAPTESILEPPAEDCFRIQHYQIGLTRAPCWEQLVFSSLSKADISTLGGTWDYGSVDDPMVGDVPARLAGFSFSGCEDGGGPLYEFWAGFRTARFGTIANFVPVWDYGLAATTLEHTTTRTYDADAYGDYMAQCTFSTQSMLSRAILKIEDVTANDADQRGMYNVLLRANVTNNTTTCRVRLLNGMFGATNWRAQSPIEIDGETAYKLYPMGTISFPPARTFYWSDYSEGKNFETMALRIDASRTAGAGYLNIDCLILIPYAEGAIHVKGGQAQYVGGDSRASKVFTDPLDRIVSAWSYTGSNPLNAIEVDVQNWGLPSGAGRMIVAAQQSTVQTKTDKVTATMDFLSRWRTLRGANTYE